MGGTIQLVRLESEHVIKLDNEYYTRKMKHYKGKAEVIWFRDDGRVLYDTFLLKKLEMIFSEFLKDRNREKDLK